MAVIRIFSIAFLLFASPCSAEIFKWYDEKGQVHYGDKPVNNSQPVEIDDRSFSGAMDTSARRSEQRQKLLDAMEEDRQKKNKEQAKQEKQEAKNKRQCIRARDRLLRFEKAGSLYNLDENGNRVTLSEEQKKKTIEDLRKNIELHCSFE